MRVGLIADIHGNRSALGTVLAHITNLDVDHIICLGDVAALGPDPAGCVDLIAEHALLTTMGSTDAWMLQHESEVVTDDPVSNFLATWCRSCLSEEQLGLIGDYVGTSTIELSPAVRLQVFHGTPGNPDGVISPSMSDSEMVAALGPDLGDATIFAGGHTHVQMLRKFGQQTIVNPGSVGLPGVGPGTSGLSTNTDVHWAEFAVVDSSAEGTTFEFLRTPLSVRQMLHEARRSGMPEYSWWASKWRLAR